MANAPHSSVLFDNVNRILSTFVPAHGPGQQLYTSIGVKSHGTITFSDNKSSRAEFIRIPPDASVTHVKELLTRQWCNGRPSLVISVTGGAKAYNMKPRLFRAFRRGLLKVAQTTGAWIITGGMNTGIMKLVGETVQINHDRSRPIHLIGIATWGCVSGFQQLDVHGSGVHYSKPRNVQKGEAPLESNHTKFIFVDDGSERKYGREIKFRAKLEQAISNGFFGSKTLVNSSNQYASLAATSSIRSEHSIPVPVVLLVVEGGPNTVLTVHEAVVENNIPAVFLEGTGRCCDLFAKAYDLYRKYYETSEFLDETSLSAEDIKNKLREDLQDELNGLRAANDGAPSAAGKALRKSTPAVADNTKKRVDTTDYFELVYECIHTRNHFLNIIRLDSHNPVEPDIDLGILYALLKATSGNDVGKTSIQRTHEQLHLALEWNRVDIAKNYIMRNEQDWETINLDYLFLLALERNQKKFVELFLDHDFSLTDLFGNTEKLLDLYRKHMKDPPNLRKVYKDPLRAIYKIIIQPLIGDFFKIEAALPSKDNVSNNDIVDENDDAPVSCCKQRRYRNPSIDDQEDNAQSDGSATYTSGYLDVDRELLFWSVISGRREFAFLFWSRGKNKICAALIAALIYRKNYRKTNDSIDKQSADEFETLAVKILDKFYQVNPAACTKAIIRQIPAYGNVTWLEVAVVGDAKRFIAQRAVQDVLNNIWYGYIDQKVSVAKIVFSTFMIWYSGFLRYENELVKTNDEVILHDDSIKSHPYQRQTSSNQKIMDRTTDTVHMSLLTGRAEVDNAPVQFVDFGCWEKTKTQISNYFNNITTFFRAPYVKYIYNVYSHVLFLLLFSYVMLCDFFPLYNFPTDICSPVSSPTDHKEHNNDDQHVLRRNRSDYNEKSVAYGFRPHKRPSTTEYILVVWVFTLLCEEIRQLFTIEAQSKRNAIIAYFKSFWNKLDVLAIILFLTGFILRFLPTSECFCAARIILSVDLALWYMRSLDIFAAIKRLGPKLVMIGEMVHDLKFFMLMLAVFILAFGVPSYGLIYGVNKFSWHLPREIINFAYWQIFGELNALETFEHNFKANGYAAFILLVTYMAIVSILLVNLLIAMFSNTFDRLQNDTDRIWKFQRYSLVYEYLTRPALPPPFIIFSHISRLILTVSAKFIESQCIQKIYAQHIKRTKYKIFLDEQIATNIEIAEDAIGDDVYYNHLKTDRKLIDETDLDEERVQTPQDNMLNKIHGVENRIQALANQQALMFEYIDCLMNGLKTLGGDRIKMPERRRFDTEESFEESAGTGDSTRRTSRRESFLEDYRYRSNSNPDELQSRMKFFSSRK